MKKIIVILLVLTVVISGVIASVPEMFDFGTRASTPILLSTTQTGDLVVGEGETQTIENETFILEGNITVNSGGTLIIRNSDITVNSHYKNNYWVRVYSDATLLVENSLLREGPVPGLASMGSFGGIDDFRMGETVISPEGDGAQVILRNSTSELRTGPGPDTIVTLEYSYLSILFWRSFPSTITTMNGSNIKIVHMWLHGETEENIELSSLRGGENQSMYFSVENAVLDIENTTVGSYSLALWVPYGEIECRKNITVRDSTLNEIFAVFPIGSDIRLWDMAPAYFENWNIYDSMDGSGVPWNLSLINTTLEKWKLDFHGVTEIENSRFHLDTWGEANVTVRNSTIILHHSRGGYVKFINTLISQSLGPPASMRFLYQPDVSGPNPPYVYEFENSTFGPYAELEFTNDDIYSTFKGNLSVNISFDQVYWFGGTVDREYPVQVLGANGAPIAGVQLSLVRSDDTQVWSGVTDENGRASFHLVFGKDNYTENFTLMAIGDTDMRMEVGFLTSTPISLISLTHAPIYINGNSDFAAQATSEGWAGNGSEANPYIIENYDINASSANGIDIENTDVYFIIRNCVIYDGKNNYNYGIYFYNVTQGKINNVTSYNNSYGIYLDYSSNNQITNCNVYNNSYSIFLSSSSNNNITNCNVYNNNYDGIWLYSSSNNTITNCTIYNNSCGICLASFSNNNQIYHNNLINNTNQAYDFCSNYWDNSIEGNYWSDYTGVDMLANFTYSPSNPTDLDTIQFVDVSEGADGIGNTPYSISGGSNQDHFPLMRCVEEGLHTTTIVSREWDFGDGNLSTSQNPAHQYFYGGLYCVKLDVTDDLGASNTYQKNIMIRPTKIAPHSAIYISSNSGFTAENGVVAGSGTESDPYIIENWDINASSANGITIEYVSYYTDAYFIIKNCIIANSTSEGISLWWSSNGKIIDCSISNNPTGIYLLQSSGNEITNCTFSNNSYGINLADPAMYNVITNCTFSNNLYGIYLHYTCSANVIHHNNFINNTCQAYDDTMFPNTWDDGTQGNYWCDYTGNDTNGDGIGDTPYNIPGRTLYGGPCKDRYPFMNPIEYVSPTVSSTLPSEGDVDVSVNISIVIVFSEPINKLSVPGHIAISPGVGIQFYNWSTNNKTLTLGLSSNLSPYTNYTITITTNVKDLSGNSLQAPYVFSFRTKDITPPSITNIQAHPSAQEVYGRVNITAFISDNIRVNQVYVNITYPNGSLLSNFSMTGINLDANGNGTYYYNFTYSVLGTYSYYIWTNDTNANGNKSPEYHFTIMLATVATTVDGKAVNITGIWTGTINMAAIALPQPPPENLQYITCIEITITGTLTYANITIKYNDSDVAGLDELTLRMYYWNETTSEWKICERTGVGTVNNLVWANVTHLTIFAPMAEKATEVAPPPVNLFLYAGIAAIIIIVISATSLLVVVKRRKKLKEAK